MISQSRLLLISCACVLAGVVPAAAQPFEIFGGYTAGKMRPEDQANRATLTGWSTSITAYPESRFGITADLAGYYGTANPGMATDSDFPSGSAGPVSVRQHSFLAGPQFRLMRKTRFETSFRALFGAAYGYAPDVAHRTNSETTFAALFGGNFDVNLSRRVGMRFSPGLYMTQFGDSRTQKNLRFSFGPVFRLGGGEE